MKYKTQQGNSIVTALILLVGLAFVFACYNPSKVPDRIRDALPDHQRSDNNSSDSDGTYAVQVMTLTNREEAFAYKRALVRDGYSARVEEDTYGQNGIRYKIRIGRYEHKSEALGVRDRIVRVYTEHFDDSFVYRY